MKTVNSLQSCLDEETNDYSLQKDMTVRHESLIHFLLDSNSPEETLQLVCNPDNNMITLGKLLLHNSLRLWISIHQTSESFDEKTGSLQRHRHRNPRERTDRPQRVHRPRRGVVIGETADIGPLPAV